MRSSLSSALRYLAPLVLLPAAAGIAYGPALGCSSDSTAAAVDAGPDAADTDAEIDDGQIEAGLEPVDAATVCTLDDQGDDPVSLCTQKIVLSAWKAGARLPIGVAPAWNATTGVPVGTDGGAAVHDFHADIAYAAAIANYHLASFCYGDTTLISAFDADLYALQPTLLADFATLPAEYTGDTYFHLRRAAAGLRYQNYVPEGDAVDALAEAYGKAISSSYFVDRGPKVAVVGDAGASDAGDAGDAGGSDAGDAGDAGAPLDDGIIGTGSGTSVTYVTVDAATAAFALLDLASRHTADTPAQAAIWEAEAVQVFDHLYTDARDSSGFYHAGGTTGPAGTVDTPTDVAGPNGYTFTTNVQGRVAELFLQAASTAAANTLLTVANAYPFSAHGTELYAALEGTALYDSVNLGFFAGITPATGAIDTTKTLVGNAAMYGFLVDEVQTGTFGPDAGGGGPQGQHAGLAAALVNRSLNMGFLGVLPDQQAYVPVATATFGSIAPADVNYTSSDTSAALDALAKQLPSSCGQ